MIHHVEDRAACACLGVERAIDQPRDTGMEDSPGAHRAGLQRDVQRAAGDQPVIFDIAGRVAERNDLRMRRGVVVADNAVLPSGNDLAFINEDRSDRDFLSSLGIAGLGDCSLEEVNVFGCW